MRTILSKKSNKTSGAAGDISIRLNKGTYYCGTILSTEIAASTASIDKPFAYCSDKYGKVEIETPTTACFIKILEDDTTIVFKTGNGRDLCYEYTTLSFLEPFVYEDLFLNDSSLLKYASIRNIGISAKIFDGSWAFDKFKGYTQYAIQNSPLYGNIDDLPAGVRADLRGVVKMTGGDLSDVLYLINFAGICTYSTSVDRSGNTTIKYLNLKITNSGGLDLLLIDLAGVSSWTSDGNLYLWGERTSASDSAIATIKANKASGDFQINGVDQ